MVLPTVTIRDNIIVKLNMCFTNALHLHRKWQSISIETVYVKNASKNRYRILQKYGQNIIIAVVHTEVQTHHKHFFFNP